MASSADLLDLYEQGVAITIQRDVFDRLGVAAAFSLHPELLTRAAPKVCFASGNRFLERGPVHPGHHENPPRSEFLDDSRDQAVGIELQFVVKRHSRSAELEWPARRSRAHNP